ncbi:hypothetical protein [Synoicihabitans lomoniglobus]|uniref:Uncharacterized protein n=1 Tax=Synoicihabitans lomoniglobus TaxID=2909285 RepID=A0AAE9ZSV7_9BACT|nr:hypothetical protein [Opitutaceae bacterium LMO-M01]WED64590.1 hypothetical protein PXH66_19790 [Opitutaceae bacterium LMO-M01]
MAHLFLAIFLLVFGLNILVGISLPTWIVGLLAVIAGVLFLVERFKGRTPRN